MRLDNNRMVSGHGSFIQIWNITGYEQNKKRIHNNGTTCLIKKNFIVYGDSNHNFSIWDVNTGAVDKFFGHKNFVRCLLQLNKSEIVSGSYDTTIKIWDVWKRTCLKTLKFTLKL